MQFISRYLPPMQEKKKKTETKQRSWVELATERRQIRRHKSDMFLFAEGQPHLFSLEFLRFKI